MEHGGVNLNLTSSLGEMSIIHIGTSGEGGGASRATRTLFTGPQVPHAIKVMRKPLTQIDKTLLRRILQGASTVNYNFVIILKFIVLPKKKAVSVSVTVCQWQCRQCRCNVLKTSSVLTL